MSLVFVGDIEIIFLKMLVKYIGRESHFHGKSLYEIARNLKNFGEGRYVYRVSFSKRYKEPSFYKLTSVTSDMNAKVVLLSICTACIRDTVKFFVSVSIMHLS